ncbi:MAG TPA: type VI secretion system protein TssA [Deltaproteobacteria bacterium]|nr:type VI secretion system protein TssA [Deltaproteobacteria bacterium]
MIDIESILAPIPGDNPAGEDLRYTGVYDELKEARRADDPLDRGDWSRDIKTSDWVKVMEISRDALTGRTKDLQIAVWLAEALTRLNGFEGLVTGLKVINGFLSLFWDHVYPQIEDGDLDFRAGPLEFLNEKFWVAIKDVPVTDPRTSAGYSWVKWQESRKVGYEKDTLNQYGDVDEGKKRNRDELLAEGKLPADEFDSAVAASSRDFYEKTAQALTQCLDEFKVLDALVDEKFGKDAPRLAELRAALEDCDNLLVRILKEKRQLEPDSKKEREPEQPAEARGKAVEETQDVEEKKEKKVRKSPTASAEAPGVTAAVAPAPVSMTDQGAQEDALWQESLEIAGNAGTREALERLRNAAETAPSVRQQNRYRLLVAKLCLEVGRPDLARPVVEGIYALIEELGLEKWESPLWVAEVLDAYYQCLTAEGTSDDDQFKARTELFQKLCIKDITKAMSYKT